MRLGPLIFPGTLLSFSVIALPLLLSFIALTPAIAFFVLVGR